MLREIKNTNCKMLQFGGKGNTKFENYNF